MKIGIQISSDLKQKTGVEEYVYQLTEHLLMLEESKKHQIFLYSRENLKWPFKWGWTQIRLSWEILKNKLDVLFVPAHTFPLIHPKLIVTIHGLEYEHLPKMYPFLRRKILRYLTKRNLKKADKVIVPSHNTKEDLIKFYKAKPEKIFVVYHGINMKRHHVGYLKRPYLLYLGRIEKRKNVEGLIRAFEILKEKYRIPHKLVLAGPNSGHSMSRNIEHRIPEIVFTDYVDQDKKWQLLRNADVFVFPSFYEGFGFPVLEAQIAGIPVVASNVSSLPEILKDSALLINPKSPTEIAEAVYKIIRNPKFKKGLVKKGYENIKRYSWQKCARETLKILCA